MTSIGVIEFPYKGRHIRDALGRERVGWSIVEDGEPGYPYQNKDEAICAAKGLVSIRMARIDAFKVISGDGTVETVTI